ncbi:p21-activated protein kinase-interacting protein 1-like [Xenia sp. Carnegie-2017]|uniref:p21-activated protein kinase-interacting protein 1-like n=1 Tax=Xenia sp. Carnegie-2017 TaxID=2897299 RepID=UPI001F0362B0|nr:p21-activated protein kinase-interacting protein 1-like [Xenia sp. Carnegie-2017]
MEVIVGTYEQSICALNFCFDEIEAKFEAAFSDHGHSGCVKSVACNQKYLASGSTDESIRLFELRKRVELGRLTQQEGSITCLSFCNETHLLSGCEDGTLCIWECKSWNCLKILKGHRESVTSLAVHPTGRLALSVSLDKTLRTWNLLTGRSAYVTNIKQVASIVRWSPSGETYAVVTSSQVIVYKVSTAALVYTIGFAKTILAITFMDENVLAVGGDSLEVEIHDVESERKTQSIVAHETRIKGLTSTWSNSYQSDIVHIFLFSVSSDGVLKAWRFKDKNFRDAPDYLCQFALNGRPTCITVFTGKPESIVKSSVEKKQTLRKTLENNEKQLDKKFSSESPASRRNKSKKRTRNK